MSLPFSVEQFIDVFRRYNEAVWPAQLILAPLAIAAAALAAHGSTRAGRVVSAVLAILWLWMGVVYHLVFFRPVNPLATLFGALFIAQAALFAWVGVWRGQLRFGARADFAGFAGAFLVVLALGLYPAIGYALGHRYPANPTFGLPCPTTIFTFALLAWATSRVPRVLLIVPVLWAAVGTVGAVQLGMREDLALPIAAVLGMLALERRRFARRQELRPASV